MKTKDHLNKADKKKPWDIIIVMILGIVLLYIGMSHMIGKFEFPLPEVIDYKKNPINFAGIQWAISTVILLIGRKFYFNGIKSLLHKAPNMDTLVALGTGSAYLFSLYSLIQIIQGNSYYIHSLYFESAGVVVALVMFGKYLEKDQKKKHLNQLLH